MAITMVAASCGASAVRAIEVSCLSSAGRWAVAEGWRAREPTAAAAQVLRLGRSDARCGSVLRLAPRRSEHGACASGEAVLSAGEMSFREESGRFVIDEVSNQSTGYCPDVGSWPAISDALDRAGILQPAGFTQEVVFRRCLSCQQLNVVREDDFVCVFCDEVLPQKWNVDGAGR